MPLSAVIAALDNVEAAHRDLYAETEDGRFILDIDGDISGHPAVTPLENAYRKEQDKRKRQGRELDALKVKISTDTNPDGEARDVLRGATHKRDLEAAANQAARYRSALESTLVDAALTNALVEARIAPPFMKAAKAMHRANFTVVEGDDGFQVVGDGSDGNQDASAYIAAWAGSAEGRAFIAAPRNGGGAANGSGAAGARTPNPWRDESFNRTEQARIARDDPALAKRLARAAGRPEPRV